MDRFEPIHDAHAIEQVALAALVSQPLEDAELAAALNTAEQFRSELPGTQQLQLQTISFGVLGIPPRSPGGPFGKLFTSTRRDGSIESELRVDRNGIAFRTTAYTRWAGIWEQARRYFEALLPLYLARGEIGSIALNYIDKFYWDGKAEDMRPNVLLRPGSPYVCPHVYDATDLWHSHTGVFHRVDETIKRLININLDCNDENKPEQRRTVTITTVLTDMLNQPGYSPLRLGDLGIKFFCDRATTLHADNKVIVGEILTDQMCHRIGLTD
jgi:uncharacterized protein (TIGR04255 family)